MIWHWRIFLHWYTRWYRCVMICFTQVILFLRLIQRARNLANRNRKFFAGHSSWSGLKKGDFYLVRRFKHLWPRYDYKSSIWHEFDPDTAYVVCLSVSLGFAYMVMLQTFKRKRHCSGCGVAMGCYGRCNDPAANIVTSQCYGRYYITEHARTWAEHLSRHWQREFTAITGCQSTDSL